MKAFSLEIGLHQGSVLGLSALLFVIMTEVKTFFFHSSMQLNHTHPSNHLLFFEAELTLAVTAESHLPSASNTSPI